ncbi:MAG: DUF4450 domain-containing protein [Niabella sp.]|nr:DUF4450 domain-containing protein [Niabella sp.]
MKKNLFVPLVCLAAFAAGAQTIPKQKTGGDYIENISYNESKRGTARSLQYRPDGDAFVCVNGKNRYTRALYGGPTAFRLETSDRPVFAAYYGNNSQNISFRISVPGRKPLLLDAAAYCESRYSAGSRSYRVTDPSWGNGTLQITALALYQEDGAIWKITATGLPKENVLTVSMARIKAKKLNRNGDMGADPPDCFEAPENPQYTSTQRLELRGNVAAYVVLSEQHLTIGGEALFTETEKTRAALAARIRISTPDPFINTIGGTLTTAADGIWDGTTWLHGAIGWRMPLTGWRAAYAGDFLGWHDRARIHFNAYAASQVTNVPNTIPHPAQDTALHLARALKRWGTPMYSNGYICRNPNRNDQMHHYDMNLNYIDELLWHLEWTGDLDYARTIWPVLTRHLAWEKLNFDPDGDGLYDAYACIWASDALYYNSGAVTHSSAFNYRANKLAALIAQKIGQDPKPYQQEAGKILSALNARLWLKDKGHWAEYQDFMGLKRLHESAAVWTIYHAIDCGVADPFQAYQATRYVDTEIPHIPVRAKGLTDEGYATVSTTNWMPYVWSTNNVAFEEVMHTALAYFIAGRNEAGFKLLKSSVLDGMYLGDSPGNIGQVSFYDAARGESYRDFGDAIGVASRVFIQGLFGITPDALNNRLLIRPGFPASWDHASIQIPDVSFSFQRNQNPNNTTYRITRQFAHPLELELQVPALWDQISTVTINGRPVRWKRSNAVVGYPLVSVMVPAANSATNVEITITWGGNPIVIPPATGNRTAFKEVTQGAMTWWSAVPKQADEKKEPVLPSFTNVTSNKCSPVLMDDRWNASVADIFNQQYLSPRSPYTTLQIPTQGIGEWCHPLQTATINDSGLRAQVRNTLFKTSIGVPFRTPASGSNISFTSLWDNYPDSVAVALSGKATHAYLLLAGSTNQMQSHIANGSISIEYTDGSKKTVELINPENWCPIEQDYFEDGYAFKLNVPRPYRLHFKTGIVSNNLEKDLHIRGVYGREIDGGAGQLMDIQLEPGKTLKQLVLKTLSNDVIIGLMSITLQRP